MAKVSITERHDYMRFTVTFPDKQKVVGNFSRNGENIRVEPENVQMTRKLGYTFFGNSERMKTEKGWNYRETFKVVEAVGKEAKTVEDFIEKLDAKLGQPYRQDLPAGPEKTAVVVGKKGRGMNVKCHFPSGEKVSLTINQKSVAVGSHPQLEGLLSPLTMTIFACQNFMDPVEIADRMKDAAETSADLGEWVETVKQGLRPAPRM